MTTEQKLVIGKVSFRNANGNTQMIVEKETYFDYTDLSIEDLETIGDFFNRVISAYHAHEYRLRGEPE